MSSVRGDEHGPTADPDPELIFQARASKSSHSPNFDSPLLARSSPHNGSHAHAILISDLIILSSPAPTSPTHPDPRSLPPSDAPESTRTVLVNGHTTAGSMHPASRLSMLTLPGTVIVLQPILRLHNASLMSWMRLLKA